MKFRKQLSACFARLRSFSILSLTVSPLTAEVLQFFLEDYKLVLKHHALMSKCIFQQLKDLAMSTQMEFTRFDRYLAVELIKQALETQRDRDASMLHLCRSKHCPNCGAMRQISPSGESLRLKD